MLRFQSGDQRAFQNLFDGYKKRVINYCYRYCGHRAIAEELAQETFLRVLKGARRYQPKARFSTWLFKIATNVCLNEMRRAAHRQQMDSLDEATENVISHSGASADLHRSTCPENHLMDQERRQMVRSAIARLPDKQRAALLLRVEGGFSYGEIGRQIDQSENYVKTLIHRGRMRLRKALATYLGEKNAQAMPK